MEIFSAVPLKTVRIPLTEVGVALERYVLLIVIISLNPLFNLITEYQTHFLEVPRSMCRISPHGCIASNIRFQILTNIMRWSVTSKRNLSTELRRILQQIRNRDMGQLSDIQSIYITIHNTYSFLLRAIWFCLTCYQADPYICLPRTCQHNICILA